ncbi:hypothetical protein GW7_01072 [Heterocephalus glaber]|uniref:Uncharacterized protein n=1 Tax=Heterocephalus glaber TaxID=10181 RepID=G5AMH5_HETGA|nr:hypothetical protein GW7_01072 [Heterocephalus glaber]
MAMTSVRLFTDIFKKPEAWIGLWGVLQGTSSHKLCASCNRYLYFSSTKLKASDYKTLFHNIFSLRFPGLLVSSEYVFPFFTRFKSNISFKKSFKITQQQVGEEDSDEERDYRERSEQEEELEDDPTVVKDYKDLEKVVQSF